MKFMGTKEAAEKLHDSQVTISRWCRENRVPHAEQDAPGSPWRIPITFTKKDLLPRKDKEKK